MTACLRPPRLRPLWTIPAPGPAPMAYLQLRACAHAHTRPGAQRDREAGLSTSCSLPSVPWFPGIKGTSWHPAPQVSSGFLLCFLKAPGGCVPSLVSENVSRGAAPGLTQGSGSERLVSSSFSTAPSLHTKQPVAGDVAVASWLSEAATLVSVGSWHMI